MRRLLIAAAMLTLTAYLTGMYPLSVSSVSLSRFGHAVSKLDE